MAVIEAANYIKQQRLTPAHTGNVSVRLSADAEWASEAQRNADAEWASEGRQISSMLITPTGLPYENLKWQDIVLVNPDGSWDKDGLAPSSEWQFHLAAYKANDAVNALVHTHANYATTLACAGKEIPAFHYMVAAAGGEKIPLVPYAIFGSKELSDHVAIAFSEYKACLMAHHGLLTGAETIDKAVELTEIIEDLAKQYWGVLQLGQPSLLTESEMQTVLQKFKTYGQQNKP